MIVIDFFEPLVAIIAASYMVALNKREREKWREIRMDREIYEA